LHYSAEYLKSMLVVLETADMKLALECYKRLEPGGGERLEVHEIDEPTRLVLHIEIDNEVAR
jgi:hypothetical protein